MKRNQMLIVLAAVLLGAAATARAQMPMHAPGEKSVRDELSKFFGRDMAFSATAQMSVKSAQGKQAHSMEMDYAVRDGKVRTEMDVTKMKSADMPASATAEVKRMGMDKTIHIVRPDLGKAITMYPGLKAYAEMKLEDAPKDAARKIEEAKMEKTEVGKETIDGHPCVKYKVVVTSHDGKKVEGFMWTATDLKDIPIKTEYTAEGDVITTIFKNIKTDAPAASLFEPPAGYKRYGSVHQMMMGSMHQMMQQHLMEDGEPQ